MLLVYQAGSVKIGEVIRYTLTYTPTYDRILPSPTELHVKIKNTSAIPLRAAYLHGPYTLHVSTYPSTFNPNQKTESPKHDGVPNYEPNLKAGGHWSSTLVVPDDIRESGEKVNSKRNLDGSPKTVRWIIEISSQILFSNSASVHYELLVARDERSLDLGFAAAASRGHGEPGTVKDFKYGQDWGDVRRPQMPKGVYSRALDITVEDTAALWDKPALPQWQHNSSGFPQEAIVRSHPSSGPKRREKPKKLHLVILTHGLHSNVGGDMLYLKESIDSTARQAREDKQNKKKGNTKRRNGRNSSQKTDGSKRKDAQDDQATAPAPQSGGQDRLAKEDEDEEDSDDEQVVVRGFAGNSVRTEKGIQYLGKRLAKFVLTTTYPDQPFLPHSRSMKRSSAGSFPNTPGKSSRYGGSSSEASSNHNTDLYGEKLPYTFTSISFIGHSLGGLVQTYAIAYIHKHSPEFFTRIKPVNYIAMASPMLGLSNENPLYIKFALDFGLVGRTGQDLGLTWKPPALARSGWKAMLDFGSGGNSDQGKHEDPRAKPLLRILPTGPAHEALKLFRNRTVYSNVVNDGIVPLRTSCLLFLDWRGLDKVENARRENGLIGTVASFGWAELTGANTTAHRHAPTKLQDHDIQHESDDETQHIQGGRRTDVPQPDINATTDDNKAQQEPLPHQFLARNLSQEVDKEDSTHTDNISDNEGSQNASSHNNPLNGLLNLFRPSQNDGGKSPKPSNRAKRAYSRAQTLKVDNEDAAKSATVEDLKDTSKRPIASRGDSMIEDPTGPPPRTSVFEAAGDLLNPPLPPLSWLIDPSTRSRTIFHDRVYHPEDIPPPPPGKRALLTRSFSTSTDDSAVQQSEGAGDSSGMKVEEKIARAYHRDLSWRKVLVRLEPDAHNNMIVRRMFANAYGWDVIKHVCDTHFADTPAAKTRDSDEPSEERAKPVDEPVPESGNQIRHSDEYEGKDRMHRVTTELSEAREAADKVPDLEGQAQRVDELASSSGPRPRRQSWQRQDSAVWHDSVFDESGDEDDDDADERPANLNPFQQFQRYWNGNPQQNHHPQPHDGQRHGHQEEWTSTRLSIDTSQTRVQPSVANAITQSPAETNSPMSNAGQRSHVNNWGSLEERGNTAELGLARPSAVHLVESPTRLQVNAEETENQGVARTVARQSSGEYGLRRAEH